MVEVTCKQQKWRRGEKEDATKNTCGIQTRIDFQQQEDKTCPSDSSAVSIDRKLFLCLASDVITILSSKMMSRSIHLKDDCCWRIKEWKLYY